LTPPTFAAASDDLGWLNLSEAEREREYSPSSCIGGDYMPFIEAYIDRSAQAHTANPPVSLSYGSSNTQSIDLFLPSGARGPVPVLVFIHGGYWQELSKKESAFAAPACLDQGFAFAAIDYTLAPQATVSDIVAECRAAIAFLAHHGSDHGIDPDRMVVAGSSAGGHLAAMVALGGEARNCIRGAVMVSGVFALEPLIGTSINEALGLDAPAARASSPLLQDLEGFPPSVICWGENETDQFKRQSTVFAQHLRDAAGASVEEFESPGRNHFDVILDLTDPDTPLGRATLTLLRAPLS